MRNHLKQYMNNLYSVSKHLSSIGTLVKTVQDCDENNDMLMAAADFIIENKITAFNSDLLGAFSQYCIKTDLTQKDENILIAQFQCYSLQQKFWFAMKMKDENYLEITKQYFEMDTTTQFKIINRAGLAYQKKTQKEMQDNISNITQKTFISHYMKGSLFPVFHGNNPVYTPHITQPARLERLYRMLFEPIFLKLNQKMQDKTIFDKEYFLSFYKNPLNIFQAYKENPDNGREYTSPAFIKNEKLLEENSLLFQHENSISIERSTARKHTL